MTSTVTVESLHSPGILGLALVMLLARLIGELVDDDAAADSGGS